jgi:hypothetical protein
MSTCKRIQKIIVADEALSPQDLSHIQNCQQCTSFEVTEKSIKAMAQAHRQVDQIDPQRAVRVSQDIQAALERKPAGFRLAWASMILLFGIVSVTMVLWAGKQSSVSINFDDQFIGLLDEVESIVTSDDQESNYDYTFEYFASLLDSGADNDSDLDNYIPESYLFLEDILDL